MSVTTGITVVPTAGMKSMALEVVNALDRRQLGPIQWPVGVHDKTRLNTILSVCGNQPTASVFVPLCGCNQGLQQRLIT